MEYACSLDFRGRIPRWFANSVAVPQVMMLPYKLQTYFLQVKPTDSSAAADGTLLGHMLLDAAEAAKKPERASVVKTFVERAGILRASSVASLDALLIATLGERGHDLRPKAVVTNDPATLTAVDATTIGRGFDAIIRFSATPSEAVDELLQTYAALGVAAQRHDWLRPMLETIAKRRAAEAPLGLKSRLVVGAVLSIGDTVSDAVQVVSMFLAGRSVGALALLGMIAMNLAFQMLVVIVQNARLGWQVVLREIFIVLLFLKPAVDAIRVAGGAEQAEGAPINPLVEMVICKMSEMVFESIPGGLAQASFLLDGGDWTVVAVISIIMSCFSTAFIATTLAYDLDTSAANRKKNPKFFGYMPDTAGGRVLAFMLLFLYHSSLSVGKTFSMAVLAQTNWVWLVAYLLADHCGLILYKLARGDLIYWIPAIGVPLSVCARFLVKVVADFTGYAVLPSPRLVPCPSHPAGLNSSLHAHMTQNKMLVAVVSTFGTR
jgi:hypothetical protein